MTLNIFLALIAVVLGTVAYRVNNKIVKFLLGVLWLLFLPNTIYLFTDLINLIKQWGHTDFFQRLVLIFQYSVLQAFGFVTFILGLYPFEKYLRTSHIVKVAKIDTVIIVLNFVVAFGITLGRVERINSWDVFQNPIKVINSSLHILSSFELLGFTILFAVFSSISYLLLRKPIVRYFSTYLVQVGVL